MPIMLMLEAIGSTSLRSLKEANNTTDPPKSLHVIMGICVKTLCESPLESGSISECFFETSIDCSDRMLTFMLLSWHSLYPA